jgi:hypothetical protein
LLSISSTLFAAEEVKPSERMVVTDLSQQTLKARRIRADESPVSGSGVLEPAMLVGLGCVALWLYLRFPRLRPATIRHAMVHVALSFGLFFALPYTVDLFSRLPGNVSLLAFVTVLLIPVMTYVLFSWVALIAKIHNLADSTPRGGHRVPRAAEG